MSDNDTPPPLMVIRSRMETLLYSPHYIDGFRSDLELYRRAAVADLERQLAGARRDKEGLREALRRRKVLRQLSGAYAGHVTAESIIMDAEENE